jgi:hypothetical protein
VGVAPAAAASCAGVVALLAGVAAAAAAPFAGVAASAAGVASAVRGWRCSSLRRIALMEVGSSGR